MLGHFALGEAALGESEAGAPSYVATGIAPTTVFGVAALEDRFLDATGIAPATAFGTVTIVADLVQDATGIAATAAFGTAYAAPTQFGVATSIDPITDFGFANRAENFCDATGIPRATVFGLASTPVYYALDVDGIPPHAGIGHAVSLVYLPTTSNVAPASLIVHVRFGKAAALVTLSATAIAPVTAIGTATSNALGVTLAATGIPAATAFGTPGAREELVATGIVSTSVFGTPTTTIVLTATGIASRERFGTPTIDRPDTYYPYPIPARTWFGTPRAGQPTNNATGLAAASAVGTPNLKQTYRARPIGTVAQFGQALTLRTFT